MVERKEGGEEHRRGHGRHRHHGHGHKPWRHIGWAHKLGGHAHHDRKENTEEAQIRSYLAPATKDLGQALTVYANAKDKNIRIRTPIMTELYKAVSKEASLKDKATSLLLDIGQRTVDLTGSSAPGLSSEPILLQAVAENDIGRVQRLITLGIKVDEANDYGTTPLHWAAHKGFLDIAKLLLASGASLTHTDKFGNNAKACAKNQGQTIVETFLQEQEAVASAGLKL